MGLAIGEDLEDYWDDLRPGRPRYAYRTLKERVPAYATVAAPEKATLQETLRQAGYLMPELGSVLPPLDHTLMDSLCHVVPHQNGVSPFLKFASDLVVASDFSPNNELTRATPLATGLWVLRNKSDLSDQDRSSEFWQWVRVPENSLLSKLVKGLPKASETRLLHLLLLGGYYGLYEQVAIVFHDVDELTRTKLLFSQDRRDRAYRLNSLLDEVDRWNEHLSHHVTMVLGWSGREEDAELLHGLCEPLMRKMSGSKIRLP